MPEGLRARPDVPADLGPCSSACGVDQLSRATRATVRWPARSTRSPGRLVLGSVGPQGRPVPQVTRAWAEGRGVARFPGQLALGSEGPPFDKNSRVTRVRFFFPTESTTCPARLVGPGGSTSCPEHFGPVSECPRVSTSSPWRLRPGSEGPRGRPALLDHSCPAVIACSFDKLSRATQTSVRVPVMSTSSPGPLTLGSKVL